MVHFIVTSCPGKTSKVLLLLVNISILLIGGGLLGLGLYFHLGDGLYEYVFREAEVITIPVIMMFFGALFIFVSFFSIVGALCEVVVMLKIYMGIVSVVIVLEAITMAVCVAMRGEAEIHAVKVVHSLMEHYGNETSDELGFIEKTIDGTQQWLECCGLDSPEDWTDPDKATYWVANEAEDELPGSCCVDTFTTCHYSNDTSYSFYQIGCREALEEFVTENVTYITVAGIALILAQCMILICALKIRFELASNYDVYCVDDMAMTSM